MARRKSWETRGDGEERTVKPTTAALNLLRKVLDSISAPGGFTKGMVAEADEGEVASAHCVLGWMSFHAGNPGGDIYPNSHMRRNKVGIRSRYPLAAALFVETINGPGLFDTPAGYGPSVNEGPAWEFNDDKGRSPTINALKRTILYAEHELGV